MQSVDPRDFFSSGLVYAERFVLGTGSGEQGGLVYVQRLAVGTYGIPHLKQFIEIVWGLLLHVFFLAPLETKCQLKKIRPLLRNQITKLKLIVRQELTIRWHEMNRFNACLLELLVVCLEDIYIYIYIYYI
jgi:hypothetical protein